MQWMPDSVQACSFERLDLFVTGGIFGKWKLAYTPMSYSFIPTNPDTQNLPQSLRGFLAGCSKAFQTDASQHVGTSSTRTFSK